MEQKSRTLLREIGSAVIRYREVYRDWCRLRGIPYHEMLVFYTIREKGSCTQKEICDSYALPKQTVHNIVRSLRAKGLLTMREGRGNRRERILLFTEEGKRRSASLLDPLLEQECCAVNAAGPENVESAIHLLRSFTEKLRLSMIPEQEGSDERR